MTARENPSAATRSVKITSARYEVGYCRPPRHTQFKKGRSGNPGGRPSRKRLERMKVLALREAYRSVTVNEAGRMVPLTAVAAILRSQIELAAGGNLQAQRDILAILRTIEKENGKAAVPDERDEATPNKRGRKLPG